MPISLKCPECSTSLSVPDTLEGKKVRCQKCTHVFVVTPNAPPEILEAMPVEDEIAEPEPRRRGIRSESEEKGPREKSSPRKRRNEEEDCDEPAPRRRSEAKPREPRFRERPPKSPLLWVFAGIGGFLLLCFTGGVLAFLMLRDGNPVAQHQKQANLLAQNQRDQERRQADMFAEQERQRQEHQRRIEEAMKQMQKQPGNGGNVVPQPKAPDPFVLPPLPAALEIKAFPLDKETSIKLPEPASTLRVGGGGRFLVLHFPQKRHLGIFDVNDGKIVREIATAEEDVRFAAGMNKLVVYRPVSKLIQRYDLLTGVRDMMQNLDLPAGKIEAFCMGHASAGPLLISVASHGAKLYDIDKFAEMELPVMGGNKFGSQPRQRLEGGLYWAGATGRVFGHTGNYGQPNGVAAVVFERGKMEYTREHKSTWFVVPGPDDKTIYAAGHGVVSTQIKSIPNVPFSMGPGSGYASHVYLPATHDQYYLHAMTIGLFRGEKIQQGTISLFKHGNAKPLMSLPKTVVAKYSWEELRGFGLENSIQLIPKAKLLIVVPESRDELRLYPIDLDAAQAK